MYYCFSGKAFGYHALTFGLYVDELLQHADTEHRDTDTIFQDEIAKPFGMYSNTFGPHVGELFQHAYHDRQ